MHTDETCIHVERHAIDQARTEEATQENQIRPFCIDLSIKSLPNLRLRPWFLKVGLHGFVVRVHSVEDFQHCYRTDDERLTYLCTTLIMIHISHDPENFQPLSDREHRNLCAFARACPLRGIRAMSRCTLIGASCATQHGFSCRTRNSAPKTKRCTMSLARTLERDNHCG